MRQGLAFSLCRIQSCRPSIVLTSKAINQSKHMETLIEGFKSAFTWYMFGQTLGQLCACVGVVIVIFLALAIVGAVMESMFK